VAAAPAPEEDEDDLELTERVETHGDLDVYTPPAAAAAPQPAPEPVAAPAPVEALVSNRAAEAAASAFGQLSAAIAMPHPSRTLEDVVRELLRPLLQQWLDDNLPGIVQQSVEAEVERIARGRVR
jgi:cell pole-organizing protein PopZ